MCAFGKEEIRLRVLFFCLKVEGSLLLFCFLVRIGVMSRRVERDRRRGGGARGSEEKMTNFETSREVKPVTTFDQMKLKEELIRGLYAYGTFLCHQSLLFLGGGRKFS